MHHKKGALQVPITNKLPLSAKNFSSDMPRRLFRSDLLWQGTPQKFNSLPLKIYQAPNQQDRLATIIFSGALVVKLRGCTFLIFEVHNLPPKKMNPHTHPTGERKLKHPMAGAKHLLSKINDFPAGKWSVSIGVYIFKRHGPHVFDTSSQVSRDGWHLHHPNSAITLMHQLELAPPSSSHWQGRNPWDGSGIL